MNRAVCGRAEWLRAQIVVSALWFCSSDLLVTTLGKSVSLCLNFLIFIKLWENERTNGGGGPVWVKGPPKMTFELSFKLLEPKMFCLFIFFFLPLL